MGLREELVAIGDMFVLQNAYPGNLFYLVRVPLLNVVHSGTFTVHPTALPRVSRGSHNGLVIPVRFHGATKVTEMYPDVMGFETPPGMQYPTFACLRVLREDVSWHDCRPESEQKAHTLAYSS